ncbi:PREDICTED: WD-40 repeat-containing protein MSI2-like [Nicotiana attenuata]|uniref:Wd-40 repeat-containing protein msi2 n=1 Tax=Nicotiana attenuata TaxID=49451 RepID=A0A314KTW7_NICAT|nr:PREDICTED: WD-40 repeat-containing protein MSI2-like [Nicotiana attenuata]OIT32891.1 wd-40 repeat-containing protein msi2 [Nicotiana attenuata]
MTEAEMEAAGGTEEEVEEEFSVWKKNTPLLYDLVICHALEWPSLTVQWLPSPAVDNGSFLTHKLILGTHTSGDFPNFLIVADVHLPRNPASGIEHDLSNPQIPTVEIVQKIHVDGEVNRGRCMPQKPAVVAAKTCSAEVYVFDSGKQPLDHEGGSCDPDVRLRGHDKEGYGLSWSPFKEGYLLSGSDDRKICLWDVSAMPQNKVLLAHHTYEEHADVVDDVSWHPKNENLFGSVGDDCRLIIWDLRTNKSQHSVVVHEKAVNCLSFNSYNEWILATASSDSTVGLFDMRNLSTPLHVFGSHTDEVFQVEWDPNHETVLASSAGDRRLMVWDLNRIGDEQLEGEAEDGPSELLFSHGGHKAKISDFSWNKNEPWVISSVAEDNTVEVWQMAESIYRDDDDNGDC